MPGPGAASSNSDPSHLGARFPASPTAPPGSSPQSQVPRCRFPENQGAGPHLLSKHGSPASPSFFWLPRCPVWGAQRQQSQAPRLGETGLWTMAAAKPRGRRPSQQPGGRTGQRAHDLAVNSGPLRSWLCPAGRARGPARVAIPQGRQDPTAPEVPSRDLCWVGRTRLHTRVWRLRFHKVVQRAGEGPSSWTSW